MEQNGGKISIKIIEKNQLKNFSKSTNIFALLLGLKFSFKICLRVKELTFCNSGKWVEKLVEKLVERSVDKSVKQISTKIWWKNQ